MIRIVGWTVVFLGFAAAGFVVRPFISPPTAGTMAAGVHHLPRPEGPTIEQVQKLASLVTLRVPISDVQTSRLEGLTGGLTVAIAIHGEVEIATELSSARFEDVNHEARSAVLVLQRPSVVRPRLDHDRTRIIGFQRTGLWWWVNGQAGEDVLATRAMAHAQRVLAETADRPDLRQQACEHTQAVIHEFFSAMGWGVAIRWEQAAAAP